jgi:putative transposase
MSCRVVKRAYRYRFYPTPEQAGLLNRTFGSVRYVYNRALAERSRAWAQEQRRVTFADTCRMLTGWKSDPETAWLYEVSNVALQHLQQAYVNFWGNANPRHERRDRLRLAKAQRNLSRKKKGSANRAKARVKVARVHARIADRRRDHLQKLSTRIIRESQAVIIEDLSVANMVANHTLARAISDASWSEFRRMLEYKAAWYGRTVVAIDRFYPSSKTCSACGAIAAKMPLNVRDWTCTACGAAHDRDVNAAVNIRAAGLAVLACGDGVRPPRT